MSIAKKPENWKHGKIKDLEGGREVKKNTRTLFFFFNGLIAGEYYFKLKGTEKAEKGKLCVLVEANINWSADARKCKISKFPTVGYHSSYWCKIHFLLAECCDVAVSLTAVATTVLQGCGTYPLAEVGPLGWPLLPAARMWGRQSSAASRARTGWSRQVVKINK